VKVRYLLPNRTDSLDYGNVNLCTECCNSRKWSRPDLHGERRHKTALNFTSHIKMTRNNALNKIRVAATELPQRLSQNTNMFGETTAQSFCQNMWSCKVNWKTSGTKLYCLVTVAQGCEQLS